MNEDHRRYPTGCERHTTDAEIIRDLLAACKELLTLPVPGCPDPECVVCVAQNRKRNLARRAIAKAEGNAIVGNHATAIVMDECAASEPTTGEPSR